MSRIDHIENHLHKDEPRWFAIYTKYKCEKYVVDKLKRKRIHAYVPLLSKIKKYSRKTKEYKIPLINCYAFVYITNSQYVKVLETEHVMGYIKQGKNLISIPKKEIDLLKRIVGELEYIEMTPLEFQPGAPVEIISGNLTGVRGKLIDTKGKHEFVVDLQNMGFQLQMIIDKSLLRPLNRAISAS